MDTPDNTQADGDYSKVEFKPLLTERDRVEIIRAAPSALARGAQLREALAPIMPKLLQRLVDAAMAGDLSATRLLVERYWAVPRAGVENRGLKLDTTKSLVAQAQEVVQRIAEGADLDVAAAAANALTGAVRLSESVDLAQRLYVLEAATAAPPARNVMPLRAVSNGVDISDLC